VSGWTVTVTFVGGYPQTLCQLRSWPIMIEVAGSETVMTRHFRVHHLGSETRLIYLTRG